MFIDKILADSTAVLHAFLPGTSGGQGIVNAFTGAYTLRPYGPSDVRNSLSFDWPRNNVQQLYKFRLNYTDSLSMRQMAKSQITVILCLRSDTGSVHFQADK